MKKIETDSQLREIIEKSPHGIFIAKCSHYFRVCDIKFVEDPFIDEKRFLRDGGIFKKVSNQRDSFASAMCSAGVCSFEDFNISGHNHYNDWYLYAAAPLEANMEALEIDCYKEYIKPETSSNFEDLVKMRQIHNTAKQLVSHGEPK